MYLISLSPKGSSASELAIKNYALSLGVNIFSSGVIASETLHSR
jgi:hypothetical protein